MLFTTLFSTFHWEALCFSLCLSVLFTEKCVFHWKALHFSWKAVLLVKAVLFTEKQQNQLIQHRSHIDLVFHRVHREGQLGISYILVVFGGAHVYLVVHVVYVCICDTCRLTCVFGGGCGACMHTYVFSGACGAHLCMWCIYGWHLVVHMWLVVHVVHVCVCGTCMLTCLVVHVCTHMFLMVLFIKSTESNKTSWFNTDLSFWPGLS